MRILIAAVLLSLMTGCSAMGVAVGGIKERLRDTALDYCTLPVRKREWLREWVMMETDDKVQPYVICAGDALWTREKVLPDIAPQPDAV